MHIFARGETRFAGQLGSDAHYNQVAKGAEGCSALENGWNEGLDFEGDEEAIQRANGCARLGTPCNFVEVICRAGNMLGSNY